MNLRFASSFFLLIALWVPSEVSAFQEPTTHDVALQNTGKQTAQVSFDVEMRIVVMPPAKTKRLKIWVPIPQSDNLQQIENSKLTTFPMKVKPTVGKEKVYGNQFAYFEFESPKGVQVIRHQFKATVAQADWGLDLTQIESVEDWPKSFAPYLKDEYDQSTKEQFATVLDQIIPEKYGTAADMQSIINWTSENLTYDHKRASLSADAVHALNERAGHCSDFHGLCSTFGRKIGFPSRVTYGLAMYDKASPSHCKMEVYLPKHGWVPFDVSETKKMIDIIKAKTDLSQEEKDRLVAAAQSRLFGGFRDNTWLQVTRGTNYQLSPPCKAGKVPLVRVVYAEADGVALEDVDPALNTRLNWTTAYKVSSDKKVSYPFKDLGSLKK